MRLPTVWRTLYGIHATLMFVVVVLLLFCPVLILAPTLPVRRRIGRSAVRAWLITCFVPFRITGMSRLPAGPCIVVCNHASYVDGILLTAALPTRFTFLVQHGAADWPYVGLIIRRMGVSFVNRSDPLEAAHALRALVDRATTGESMAIFPEGTFAAAPELKAFHDGAFVISAKTKALIVPAVVRGSRRFFGEGQALPCWSAIEIDVLPAIPCTEGSDRKSARALRDQARVVIAAHCGEVDGLVHEKTCPAVDNI